MEYVSRDDIAALTHEAADMSGIPYVMDIDKAEVGGILKEVGREIAVGN